MLKKPLEAPVIIASCPVSGRYVIDLEDAILWDSDLLLAEVDLQE